MTKVCIERSGRRTLIEAQGHATASEPDMAANLGAEAPVDMTGVQVCAAVSALLSALSGYVEYRRTVCEGVEVLANELDEGRAKLHFISRGRGTKKLEGAVELTVTGLLQLQRSYGEYISVEVKEEKV